MADVAFKRWFLPETPDLVGQLKKQLAVTIEGADAFAGWAKGEPYTSAELREIEARGDAEKRDLLISLREAFVTTIEPEDLFTLSRGIDWILNGLGDLLGEAEVLDASPDEGLGEMAELLAKALRELDTALGTLEVSEAEATAAADRSIQFVRDLQARYFVGMASTLELKGRAVRIGRRELYRRLRMIGVITIDVAERVVYSVVKES